MLQKCKPYVKGLWVRFRKLPFFMQLLLVFPVACAIAFTFLVGNMGLALMGTAIAVNSLIAGWVGGIVILILGKAGLILNKDRQRQR
ncbi:hypothetical protein [Pseudotabrizicola formosa]|uniref:hypothetical protein n=1 Tax=Pseudotabrizicola formosa TaxID=2030009 RepID=UPI000CD1FF54|nr:hypothetical protein [Pseudotabrizicola formosa]